MTYLSISAQLIILYIHLDVVLFGQEAHKEYLYSRGKSLQQTL